MRSSASEKKTQYIVAEKRKKKTKQINGIDFAKNMFYNT